MKSVTNLNSKVYYHGQYWNDIPIISEYIQKRLTGDENKSWIMNFKEKYASKPFGHALFLNCGDGRWEREFIDRKIVKKVTAFDVSPSLIKKAKELKGKRNIAYLLKDANTVTFGENSFDLVVNIAGFHHVQYLNRLCLILAKSLKRNGLLVSYDFVGPYRNQYSLLNWFLINLVNRKLPKNIRKPKLGYPHLPTMLVTDPTEAIHANLINRTIGRYFVILDKRDVGGGIAYELFTHNSNFSKNIKRNGITDKKINDALKNDWGLTKTGFVPTFSPLL